MNLNEIIENVKANGFCKIEKFLEEDDFFRINKFLKKNIFEKKIKKGDNKSYFFRDKLSFFLKKIIHYLQNNLSSTFLQSFLNDTNFIDKEPFNTNRFDLNLDSHGAIVFDEGGSGSYGFKDKK